MNTFALLLLAMGAAFAVVLAIRSHLAVEEVLRELSKTTAKLSSTEADLSTLQRRLESLSLESAGSHRPHGPIMEPALPRAHGADPRVYVQRVADQPHDRVILSNRSTATAHHLTLELSCPGGLTPFLPEFADRNFPVDVLLQGVPYIVLASFRGQCRPPANARLEWRDPDGSLQVREFPLAW